MIPLFFRTEVAAYIQAANRVSEYSPVGAPMSCLMKLPSAVAVLYELDAPTSLEGVSFSLRSLC